MPCYKQQLSLLVLHPWGWLHLYRAWICSLEAEKFVTAWYSGETGVDDSGCFYRIANSIRRKALLILSHYM